MTVAKVVEEWNNLIRSWMIANKQASVCGLAHISDGAVFAAAAMEGDAVDQIYKPTYEVMMPQEDGTDKLTQIDEPSCIKFAAENLRAPGGLWVAGQKYKIVRTEEACEHNDMSFKTLFCAKPKGGCCVIITPKGIIILSIYNEEEGQQLVNVKTSALNFAEYLVSNGY